MNKLLTLVSVLVLPFLSSAQSPTTSIATWKNDAKGAYSFIHDDYGDNGVQGINDYADTIARNRGIKFTIGAITSACEANPAMWTQAIDMINYGHEIINHSHNHYCAVGAGTWCTTGLWAEPGTQDFATEMTQSNTSIINNTGTTPRFFIYPYDLFNDAANNHLKSLNYIGSRTGSRADNASNFAPDADGFFKTNFYVKTDDNGGDITAIDLDYWSDQASANNSWINREMHNVGPTGWGRISISDYRSHLTHLQTEVAANNLWVGTISEVLTYQIQKLNYTPSTAYNAGSNTITVSWNTPSFDVATYLAPLTKKCPVTILVNLDGIDPTGLIVTQNGVTISAVTVTGGIMKFDAYPSEGGITINSGICSDFCLVAGLSNTTASEGANASFSINITATPTVTYAWYYNDVLISGDTAAALSLTAVLSTEAGTYKVVASKAGNLDITSSATLTVENQTPYNNTIASIPGVVQFENFDVGGQGISFNEGTGTNQGGSTYRTEPVDLETKGGGGYKLGYSTAGEWLEYTVDVTENAIYDLDVNNASEWAGGAFTLSIDGVDVSSNLTFSPSGGWTTWQITSFTNITLTKGQHVLRVTITADDTDFDYMEFKINQIITSNTAVNIDYSVYIYPNPFNSDFRISSSGKTIQNISISTLAGKKVLEMASASDNTILGESLSAGVYILQFSIDGTVYRKKIVKE